MLLTSVQSIASIAEQSSDQPVRYSLEVIREEVRNLVKKGLLRRNQPIFAICEYLPMREWRAIERVLEEGEFLLRDRICDLLAQEDWHND
jgi:Domain of unknown function (DUF4327)